MNSSKEDGSYRMQEAKSAEETLRLVAALPVPIGLEDRVKAGLQAAAKNGRVLHWPSSPLRGGGWMKGTAARAAAAAAIVFVVAGGGWGVYLRVQPVQSPKVIAMPQRVNSPGGFSNAGAMRTPQTLTGPVLAHPVKETPKQSDTAVAVVPTQKKSRNAKAAAHKKSPGSAAQR
jgi:hypothetical protein